MNHLYRRMTLAMLIATLLIVGFVHSTAQAASGPAPTPLTKDEQVSAAQSLIRAEYDVLTGAPAPSAKQTSLAVARDAVSAYSTRLTARQNQKALLQEHHTRYTGYQLTVLAASSTGDAVRQTLVLSAEVSLTLQVIGPDGRPDPLAPTVSKEQVVYRMGFRAEDGRWKVNAISTDGDQEASLLPDQKLVSGLPLSAVASDTAKAPAAPEQVQVYVDRAAAARYARRYWSYYNPVYRNWYSASADCQNFISQAMQAAGWEPNHPSWWYTTSSQSAAWVNVHSWFFFVYYNNRGYFRSYLNSGVAIGDVLNIDYGKNGVLDHAMIVTAVDGWGTPYFSGHTNNRLDYSLWSFYSTANNHYLWAMTSY